uniref:MPN domain-containing protein n=1 Tax=Physcomitrium patens TaxID=3218 RepID=A0A7I4FQ00_PHYPA
MEGTLTIAAKTKRVDVDNRLPLKYYYRTADNLLKQARVYRDEGNVIDYYILLVRFSSLVSETIPKHREYRLYPRELQDYIRRFRDVITELEKLQPEVRKQLDLYNQRFLKPTAPSSQSLPSSYSTPSPFSSPSYVTPSYSWPSYDNKTLNTEGSYERSHSFSGVNQDKFGGNGTRAQVPGYAASGPGDYALGLTYNSTSLETQLKNSSLNIPRPKEETLSRHSILGPSTQRPRRESAPLKVQYPSHIDATPIELPSFFQDWNAPAQAPTASTSVSSTVAALESLSDPALWSGSQSSVTVDVAPPVTLVRQPSPPPIAAPVQTVQAVLDTHDHSQSQLSPDLVADPRPGSPQPLDDDLSKGPKRLHISTKMLNEFMRLSKANTTRNLETCGVLAGSLKKGVFYVCTLIVPKQEATSDSCQTINEEEIFDAQDKRSLFQLGWIHTHPTQSCFMSSIDLHTHYSYQRLLL